MTTIVLAVGAFFLVPGLVWLWPHCLRPALVGRKAGPIGYYSVLGLNIWWIVVAVLAPVLAFVSGDRPTILYLSAFLPWLVVVGLGYLFDQYATLVRITGRR